MEYVIRKIKEKSNKPYNRTSVDKMCCWRIEAEWRVYVPVNTIVGSDYGLSTGRRQAIIWTNDGILFWGPSFFWGGTSFNRILIGIHNLKSRKSISKCRLENGGRLVSASICWYHIYITFHSFWKAKRLQCVHDRIWNQCEWAHRSRIDMVGCS